MRLCAEVIWRHFCRRSSQKPEGWSWGIQLRKGGLLEPFHSPRPAQKAAQAAPRPGRQHPPGCAGVRTSRHTVARGQTTKCQVENGTSPCTVNTVSKENKGKILSLAQLKAQSRFPGWTHQPGGPRSWQPLGGHLLRWRRLQGKASLRGSPVPPVFKREGAVDGTADVQPYHLKRGILWPGIYLTHYTMHQ